MLVSQAFQTIWTCAGGEAHLLNETLSLSAETSLSSTPVPTAKSGRQSRGVISICILKCQTPLLQCPGEYIIDHLFLLDLKEGHLAHGDASIISKSLMINEQKSDIQHTWTTALSEQCEKVRITGSYAFAFMCSPASDFVPSAHVKK